MTATAVQMEIPHDAAMPGLARAAQGDAMLELCRVHLTAVPPALREAWEACVATEAVYQPGRACRIAYELRAATDERPTIVYARWPAASRTHATAVRVGAFGGGLELYRYPRDRRLRQIRDMCRRDWLFEASQAWFRGWLGAGELDRAGWRCSPIKYVPESRLVCRLKGRWRSAEGDRWVRAYVRIARQDTSERQDAILRALARATGDAGEPFSVPRALGALPRRHLLATEFVRGRTLRDAVLESDTAALRAACGRLAALSRFDFDAGAARADGKAPGTCPELSETAHAPGKCLGLPGTARGAGASVQPAAMLDDLAHASSALAVCVRALRGWARTAPVASSSPGPVHGDLHARQIITKRERLLVVDWDRFHLGDPTEDICNLASEIEFLTAVTAEGGDGSDLAEQVLDAWRGARGFYDPACAPWWTARACVLRAWGLLRHLRTGWPVWTKWLLERAIRAHQAPGGKEG